MNSSQNFTTIWWGKRSIKILMTFSSLLITVPEAMLYYEQNLIDAGNHLVQEAADLVDKLNSNNVCTG